jgi:hypothetical protein
MAVALALLGACGGGSDPPRADGSPGEADAATGADAADLPDAASEADAGTAATGFGTIIGPCDRLSAEDLTAAAPELLTLHLDFAADRYDDPAERPLLTDGAVEMILDGNAGGSSVMSEVFAYEVLERCELAQLIKTETEILYSVEGKKTDILVAIDGHKIGVSVTRAVTFPFGNPYTVDAATALIERKLDDILLSSAAVAPEDAWDKQILAVLAYDQQHADVAAEVWASLDAQTRADTIVLIITSDGDDTFIYTDQ